MPKTSIKLGRKMSEPSPVGISKSSDGGEEFFPNVHLEWDKGYELPDEGTMVVKFRTTRESREVKEDRHSVDLELVEIVSVTPSESKKEESTGEALDKLRAEYEGGDKE